MSEDSAAKLEQFASEVLQKALADLQPELAARALAAEIFPLRRSGSGETYESEIGAYIWRGSTLVDAVEYLLCSGGRLRMSEADVSEAILRDLRSALANV